jgi:HD-GYP domain-containing protein (c-di-GMP phosphodiesterase class II)
MHQLTIWLGASVVLVAGIIALAFRISRTFSARLERERHEAQRMSEVHLAVIEALALAIDAKDQTSHNHIRRVQSYATGIARAIGLSEQAIQAIRTAAVLHDVGQLAVPEHILAKPGPLTAEEFQKVRIHPQVGAGIVGSVPFPYPVTPLILNHHERWDGGGYPNGAKGEEIPLGARILGLVDYFDSLTSDRPYHKAMSDDEALILLEQESG